MIIFGPDLGSLASQRMGYDQMNQSAAEGDRNAYLQAQQEAARNIIAQRRAAQDQDFQAQQNALGRDLSMRQTIIGATARDDSGAFKQGEEDYRQAIRDAQSGLILPNRDTIAQAYPHFTPDKIGVLYGLAGQASVAKAQAQAAQQAQSGNPPDLTSVLKAANVPNDPALVAPVLAFVQQQRKPFEDRFSEQSDLATRANASAKISADTGTPLPTDIPWYTGANALFHPVEAYREFMHPANSPEFQGRPNGDWQKRAQDFNTLVTTGETDSKGRTTKPYENLIQQLPGGQYAPQLPANWSPAFGAPIPTAQPPLPTQPQPQPQPQPPTMPAFVPTSTAQATPPVQSTQPVATAPAGKPITVQQAKSYLNKAGGNRKKAEAMAVADGYTF